MNLRTTIIVVGALLSVFGRAAAAEPLRYEPTIVQLAGILNIEDHFGPPNYGESPEEDRIERAYVLRLDRPIEVVGNPDDDLNTSSFANVERVHLVANSHPLQRYVGQHMTVEGTLFQRHTGHHVTDVLMTVSKVTMHRKR